MLLEINITLTAILLPTTDGLFGLIVLVIHSGQNITVHLRSIFFRSIRITSDGNYIIAGEREPYWGLGYKGWMIKVDPDGNVIYKCTVMADLWQFRIHPPETILQREQIRRQAALNDAWLVKTDADGNVIYDNTYEISNLDNVVQSFQPASDGGYILGGRSNSSGSIAKIMLVKLEADESASLTTFFENFDGIVPPALPDNWSSCIKVLISNNVAEVKTMPHGSAPSQPNATFIMNGLDGSNGQPDYNAFVALVSPLVQIGPDGGTLSFWATGGNPVKVGLMTDPSDTASFTLVEEIQLTYDFTQYTIFITTCRGCLYCFRKRKR